MAFDAGTYTPGDPWTSQDFLTHALTAPRILLATAVADTATAGSYFEFRSPGNTRQVEISASAAATCDVAVERSFDDGVSWRIIEILTGTSTQKTLDYNAFYMLRLRLVSSTGEVLMRLWQDL